MQDARREATRFVVREDSPSPGFRVSTALDSDDQDRAVANAVARAKSGDAGAIRFLYIRYKDNVYGYVLSIVGDPHEAEDVTQHVFLKLMKVIGKYQAREVPFTSWLLRVARNVAVDHLRQRRDVACEEIYEPSHQADDAGRDRRAGIEQALRALPEDQRNVSCCGIWSGSPRARSRLGWVGANPRFTACTIGPARRSAAS